MTLLRLIQLAMPDNTTEVRMSGNTRNALTMERDALSGGMWVPREGGIPTLCGREVTIDANVPPCTVKFMTPGRRNYWFGWTA